MKTFVTIGLIAVGVAATQPARAAGVVICTSPSCGSASSTTTFDVNNFEAGFYVNGSQIQFGLGGSGSTSVSQTGSFVDGAAQNSFTGYWVDDGDATPENETVFFTTSSGQISDVLNFSYTTTGFIGTLVGYVITGALSAADLAAVGITPTSTAPEGALFTFNNAFIGASIQTASVPEPTTWALMTLGFAGLGYAGWRRGAKARAAAA